MGDTTKDLEEKKRIDLSSLKPLINEFRDEGDRSSVILAAAKLDLLLEQLVTRKLLPTGATRDELLEPEGPLSTFNARIQVAHRLGLIDPELTRALHLMRKIRNSFAHEVFGGSLASGAHRDRVKELVEPLRCFKEFSEIRELFQSVGVSERSSADFRAAIVVMAAELEWAISETEPVSSHKARSLLIPAWTRISKS